MEKNSKSVEQLTQAEIKYFLEWKIKKDHFDLLSIKFKDSQIIIEVASERSNLTDFQVKAIYRIIGIDFIKQTVLVQIPAKKIDRFYKCMRQIKKEYQKQLK